MSGHNLPWITTDLFASPPLPDHHRHRSTTVAGPLLSLDHHGHQTITVLALTHTPKYVILVQTRLTLSCFQVVASAVSSACLALSRCTRPCLQAGPHNFACLRVRPLLYLAPLMPSPSCVSHITVEHSLVLSQVLRSIMAGGMMQKPRFNDSIISAFTNFSDDILFTIFLKLPVKSVVCGRCVCKSWRQSLFDPHFIKMHVNRTNQDHQSHEKLFLMSSSNSFYSVDLETSNAKAVPRNFPSKSTIDIEIVGSCNGLLCLFVPARKQPSRYEQLLKLVLWNPSTGDYKNLPAVDPSVQNSHTVGFGYDVSLDDYKMVRICEIDSKYRVDMYSLKANSWKIIGNLPDLTEILNHPQPGFCLNGPMI
ncbi:hypothetical protein LguiB_014035 [Lonicera macranthoides]